MTLARIAPPGEPPVSLDDVRRHLRIEDNDDDATLDALIAVASDHLQRVTNLSLVAEGWRLYLDALPADGLIRFRQGPMISIDAVTAYDADGNPQSLDAARLRLRRGADETSGTALLPPELIAAPGLAENGLEVDFTAGFGTSAGEVPASLRQALLLHVAYMHGWRGVLSPDQQPVGLPDGYSRLVAPYLPARL